MTSRPPIIIVIQHQFPSIEIGNIRLPLHRNNKKKIISIDIVCIIGLQGIGVIPTLLYRKWSFIA